MSLEDLIVSQREIDRSQLYSILKGRVGLIKETKGVVFTNFAEDVGLRARILLFLAGRKAWDLLEPGKEYDLVPIKELEKRLGIGANTLGVLLKRLRDSYQVESIDGRYRILSQGLNNLSSKLRQREIDRGIRKGNLMRTTPSKSRRRAKFGRKPYSIKISIDKLYQQGFFKNPKKIGDLKEELHRQAVPVPMSTLSPYLLNFVRKGKLTRQGVKDGKRTVYIYQETEK